MACGPVGPTVIDPAKQIGLGRKAVAEQPKRKRAKP
jgi:hypothetical protein